MVNSQRINNYDSTLDIIFHLNSYDIDEKEMKNQMKNTFSLFLTVTVNEGAYRVFTTPNMRCFKNSFQCV